METLAFRAMNTSVLLAIDGDAYSAIGLQEARAAIAIFEERFSRFLPDSEVSQMNKSDGGWVNVSKDMLELLIQAVHYRHETIGLFDPSILPDLKRLGYDRSMDEIRQQNSVTAQTNASLPTPKPAFASLELDTPNQRARLPHGMEIDLGGIAKGWIVEQTAKLLNQYADVCAVNAGGDIFFIGQPTDGYGWDVCLEDPRTPSQILAPLHVRSGAVATSSSTKRTWIQNREIRHHLIDPRTGEPANSDWLSVTVFNASLVKAEVFAKSILIGGVGEALSLLKRNPDIAYLAVDREGRITGSENSKEYQYEFEISPR